MRMEVDGKDLVLQPEQNLIAVNLEDQEKRIRKGLEDHGDVSGIVLDLSLVDEIDSLGINLVVGLFKELEKRGLKFRVTGCIQPIKNLFNLFKLSSYFEVT